ncbi:hypothetical protein J3F82_000302 [Coemansia sp. RSA 637]|nr:hypothetical protein J3F82_000302 [Coemansia sp. RSA 637]
MFNKPLTRAKCRKDKQDLLMRLPFDVAVLVAAHLSTKDLYNCWQVCRSWRVLFTNDTILHPLFMQLSHFEQESFMFQCLPTGHESNDDGDKDLDKDGDKDKRRDETEERMKLEERASQQWLKDHRVALCVLQNLLNRNSRWRRGHPRRRIYLPPVPVDGTGSDIRESWQGAVRLIKMKAGIVVVAHEHGCTLRLWALARGYERVQEMTAEYIETNHDVLTAQRSHGAALPPFTDEQVNELLACSRSAHADPAVLTEIHLAEPPVCLDFFHMNHTLVAASRSGRIDVYDMRTAKLRRTLVLVDGRVDSVHVWLHFVIVSHDCKMTMWNHVTGELLENALPTAHRAKVTGVFVLDNERHLLSIDEKGIMIVTERSGVKPKESVDEAAAVDADMVAVVTETNAMEIETTVAETATTATKHSTRTLMDVPLYPVVLTGSEGAPYSMRLLHMTHLCVWGRFSMGHYELYEPGLRNMPPLNSLIMSDNDGSMEPAPVVRLAGEDVRTAEARAALAQLEATHASLEALYSQVAIDAVERTTHDVAPEERYHVLNIDSSIEHVAEGQVLSVDFKHALLLRRNFMQVCDFDQKPDPGEAPKGPSFGIYPVDRQDIGANTVDAVAGPDEPIDQSEFDFEWVLNPGEHMDERERAADQLRLEPHATQAGLYELESLTMRYIIGIQYAQENIQFAMVPANRVRLGRGRKFLGRHMPQVLEALSAGVGINDIMEIVPYYVQRMHEARLSKPVELVDHRGQVTSARKLCADMQRVARESREGEWKPKHSSVVSPAMAGLECMTAAMDDGRVAVGCENGYVVVTCFD